MLAFLERNLRARGEKGSGTCPRIQTIILDVVYLKQKTRTLNYCVVESRRKGSCLIRRLHRLRRLQRMALVASSRSPPGLYREAVIDHSPGVQPWVHVQQYIALQ